MEKEMKHFFFVFLVLLSASQSHAALPCVGYFNAAYRDANLSRIDGLKNTQGDVILFVGDSLTQMWTDSTSDLTKPQCGSATNSGLVDWTNIPGVKVNLGLYGITACSYLSEYQSSIASRLKPFASRVKAVVINLGTNDIIQAGKNPSANPSTQVQFIKQMIVEMSAQMPQAHFLIHNVSPCLNAACGEATSRAARVAAFNAEIQKSVSGVKNTVVQNIPIKPSDLTLDQIHFNACGYRKIAHNIKFWASSWMPGYTYPTFIPNCYAYSPTHPCDL